MKSIPRIILCVAGLIFLSTMFLLNMPVDREGEIDMGNKLAFVVGWESNTTRNTSQYVLANNTTASIMPEHICDQPNLLLVMVCSAPGNFEARHVIRQTWGSERYHLGYNISMYFLIGEIFNSSMQNDVLSESEQYGDIIQERFIDSYNNLTLKSITMVKIATNYCINTTKYLLKIDDDMYVNVPKLVRLLAETNETRNVLMGKLICGARPINNPTSKWYSPRYMYKGKTYPNYLSGTGYVMSIDVAQKLFEMTLSTPIFHLEDVYLTGICSKKARIKPRDNLLFTYSKLPDDWCELKNLITMHHFTPQRLRDTYKALSDPDSIDSCNPYTPSANASSWSLKSLFKPSRTRRRSKCQ